jgi:hypothetical protein
VAEPLVESIQLAWRSDDGWLRACAVRASRHATGLDPGLFATGGEDSSLVRVELDALSAWGNMRREAAVGASPKS